jgi:hypothetical protein
VAEEEAVGEAEGGTLLDEGLCAQTKFLISVFCEHARTYRGHTTRVAHAWKCGAGGGEMPRAGKIPTDCKSHQAMGRRSKIKV